MQRFAATLLCLMLNPATMGQSLTPTQTLERMPASLRYAANET